MIKIILKVNVALDIKGLVLEESRGCVGHSNNPLPTLHSLKSRPAATDMWEVTL